MWSCFCQNLGVLDAEELSTMITGTDEAAKNSLARIEEDITGSTESISSFQSDNLTLDSHEDDLFVDIRASIQRSSKRPPSFMNSISKMPDEKVLNEAVSCEYAETGSVHFVSYALRIVSSVFFYA